MQRIEKWQTSDGAEFVSKEEAKLHEAEVNFADSVRRILHVLPSSEVFRLSKLLLSDRETMFELRKAITTMLRASKSDDDSENREDRIAA